MRESILAGALVSLLPAFALAAVMPDHRSDASQANSASALGAPVTSQGVRTGSDFDHMMAGRSDPMKEQVKPLGGLVVNLRSPMQAPESRFLMQPREHGQPPAKTNDTRMASATRVHIFWFFGGR